MAVQRWLLKSEPETFSWSDLLERGREPWDGVRNAEARNHLRAMAPGDRGLFYHSGDERAVVGILAVASSAYPDPTTDDERWLAVDVVPHARLARPVTLQQIKGEPALADMVLVRRSRLSVSPVTKDQWDRIVALGGGTRKLR